ncbi:MAG: hypothetical protein AABZ08_09625 [Planctomycetota bacterium]
MKDRIAGFVLLGGVLLSGTLLFRHHDGSVIWGHLFEALGQLGGLLRIIFATVGVLVITARFAPKVAAHVLRGVFVVLLIAGIRWNWQSLGSVSESEPYRLIQHDRHTLLSHAETSASDYERTHLAFYLSLEGMVTGRTVIVPSGNVLDQHYLTKVARAKELVVRNYNAILTPSEKTSLESQPHDTRADGKGRVFQLYHAAHQTDPTDYRVFESDEQRYLVPTGMIPR